MPTDRDQHPSDELSPDEVEKLLSNPAIASALSRDSSGSDDYVNE